MSRYKTVRDEGFKAGQVLGSRCPYPDGTQEARQWEIGWAQGVLQRTRSHAGSPGTQHSHTGWPDWLRRLWGR